MTVTMKRVRFRAEMSSFWRPGQNFLGVQTPRKFWRNFPEIHNEKGLAVARTG
jgi:hypothetical protein